MTPSEINKAAGLLANARIHNHIVDSIPLGIRPQTLTDAYAIQSRLVELIGLETGGWFCGCTNKSIQKMLGLFEPYYGRLLKGFIFESGVVLKAEDYPPMILECEFGFKLNQDLPSRKEPYTRSEIERAILSVHPTIEVVAGHLKNWPEQDVYSVIADNGTDGALVYGKGLRKWSDLNLRDTIVQLSVNDEIVRTGTGAHVLGDPIDALVWLINARARDGDGLKKGDIHNTGTATDIIWVKPGDKASAKFSGLGLVMLSIE